MKNRITIKKTGVNSTTLEIPQGMTGRQLVNLKRSKTIIAEMKANLSIGEAAVISFKPSDCYDEKPTPEEAAEAKAEKSDGDRLCRAGGI